MSEISDPRPRRMVVFYGKDAQEVSPEMMPMEGIDDSVRAGLASVAATGVAAEAGAQNRVVFREPGREGMSVLYIWFKSGFILPFHSHDTDCLYYILGGELRIGSRTLRKGDGMFIPRNHAYGYEAGPDGVEVLEFRNATHFKFVFGVNDENRWKRIADTYRSRGATWASEDVPPSER